MAKWKAQANAAIKHVDFNVKNRRWQMKSAEEEEEERKNYSTITKQIQVQVEKLFAVLMPNIELTKQI